MNRFSFKHGYSKAIRLSFLTYAVSACLCLITITGCFTYRVTPETRSLRFYEDCTYPNLLLTQRVVPEVGEELRTFYGDSDYVRVVSKSRFGDPDEEPDLSCIYAGLREVLPGIDIIPTVTFWEQIEAQQNVIDLHELFVAPQSDRLEALQADVLIIAYHAKIDLEYGMAEIVSDGYYSDKDKETAAVVVVDLSRETVIHGSRITYEDHDLFAHRAFVIPFFGFARGPSDICNSVARQAGNVISLAMPGRGIRALVVVAAEDPVAAADNQYGAEIRENQDSSESLQPGRF